MNKKTPAKGRLLSTGQKAILINATQAEEMRAAVVDDQNVLFDLDIESKIKIQKKANIYKAKISRIEQSLNAVFVSYGSDRHGFLPVKDIVPAYFKTAKNHHQASQDLANQLYEGQELVIQVSKEERGNKGAAVTTVITLAGCYLILIPNNPKAGGVSRQVSGSERQHLKEAMSTLKVPEGMGLIARTAGMGRSAEELQWDLDALLKLWHAIDRASERKAPFLIYRESDVVLRSVRDYLRHDIAKIIVDTEEVYNSVIEHVQRLRPDFIDRVALYQGEKQLFTQFEIEPQLETAYSREVSLPSGGAIIIDPTEALISIDVNSAKATRGGDIEETALQTNLEAASEIARQLRLRDAGGLVVIDFIDMLSHKNQKAVEKHLADVLQMDRARVQVGRISRFGLLELSRQRLRPSLEESSHKACPRCGGQGVIRTVESLSLSILRGLTRMANSGTYVEIQVYSSFEVAAFLMNEKRELVQELEQSSDTRIVVLPTPSMETPHFEIVTKDKRQRSKRLKSHQILEVHIQQDLADQANQTPAKPRHEKAVLDSYQHHRQPKTGQGKSGILTGFIRTLFGESKDEEPTTVDKKPAASGQSRAGKQRSQSGSGRNRPRSSSKAQTRPGAKPVSDAQRQSSGQRSIQSGGSSESGSNKPNRRPPNQGSRRKPNQAQPSTQNRQANPNVKVPAQSKTKDLAQPVHLDKANTKSPMKKSDMTQLASKPQADKPRGEVTDTKPRSKVQVAPPKPAASAKGAKDKADVPSTSPAKSQPKAPSKPQAQAKATAKTKPKTKPKTVTSDSVMKVEQVVDKIVAPVPQKQTSLSSSTQQVESQKKSNQVPNKIERKDETL